MSQINQIVWHQNIHCWRFESYVIYILVSCHHICYKIFTLFVAVILMLSSVQAGLLPCAAFLPHFISNFLVILLCLSVPFATLLDLFLCFNSTFFFLVVPMLALSEHFAVMLLTMSCYLFFKFIFSL